MFSTGVLEAPDFVDGCCVRCALSHHDLYLPKQEQFDQRDATGSDCESWRILIWAIAMMLQKTRGIHMHSNMVLLGTTVASDVSEPAASRVHGADGIHAGACTQLVMLLGFIEGVNTTDKQGQHHSVAPVTCAHLVASYWCKSIILYVCWRCVSYIQV